MPHWKRSEAVSRIKKQRKQKEKKAHLLLTEDKDQEKSRESGNQAK